MVDHLIQDKHCFDCEAYHERTPGTGYCSEWDTIVSFDEICIEAIEMQLSAHMESGENNND